jgi:hypothetical protein
VSRRIILGRNWDKNLDASPPQADFTPPYGMVFFGLRFLQQKMKMGGGLALFKLSLCSVFKESSA